MAPQSDSIHYDSSREFDRSAIITMSPALVNGHGGSGGGGGGSTAFISTQRRGPIAAEFQGPGPAAVALPSTIGKNYHLIIIHLGPYLFVKTFDTPPPWVLSFFFCLSFPKYIYYKCGIIRP